MVTFAPSSWRLGHFQTPFLNAEGTKFLQVVEIYFLLECSILHLHYPLL